MSPLPSSFTIGILGAGQLGKMLSQSARNLGYKTHVYAPDHDPIAAQVSDQFTQAAYSDLEALQKFAHKVNVITLEFENVPVDPLRALAIPIYPSPQVLAVTQQRVAEKTLAQSLGFMTAPFKAVRNQEDLQSAIQAIGTPGILKTNTLGYDGKGQWKVSKDNIPTVNAGDYIYEGLVDFKKEISVIVARNARGDMQCFEPVENVHKNHILHTTTAPANVTDTVANKAIHMASKLAESLQVVGLLAVEMFVTRSGDVLVNEMAPRPHNSGHWTLDGCNVSQFEQAIRAVAGLPLIEPKRLAHKVVMTNLIGDDVYDLGKWEMPGAHIHIYGKKEARAGRKMGHITQLTPPPERVRQDMGQV